MKKLSPLLVDIKRGSLEDGPGTRTTVFFKGCPLSCPWCQNPEAMDPQVEIGFYPRCCIGCFDCEKVCPEEAVLNRGDVRIDRSRCTRCGKCADVCPGKGLRRVGRYYEVDQILEILLRDRVFYEGKIETARWFARNRLPLLAAERVIAESTTLDLMDLPEEAF